MKKRLAILTAILACASVMTACGADKSETSETTISETTVQSEAIAEDTSAETVSEAESETESEAVSETESAENSEEITEDTEQTESANPLQPIIDKVLSESEWPVLAEVTDPVMLTEFFTLDPENANYKEMIVMQCPISATMSEIIIINAEDVDSAKADLEARRTKAIEVDAWYPNDQILAEESIVGTNGSYAYFIIGTNAAAAEKSINDYFA